MNDLIDYNNSTDFDETKWKFANFKNYWKETYWKVHHTGGAIPWSIKHTVLLQRMITEFSATDLIDMMLYWHTSTHKPSAACKFDNFYANRIDVYHNMKRATSDYNWEE